MFTLILCPGTDRGLSQVFQQERLEDFRALMESSDDVQQPPASLAAITAQSTQIHSGLEDQGREEHTCVCWFVYKVNVVKSTYGLELVLAVSCLRSWQ